MPSPTFVTFDFYARRLLLSIIFRIRSRPLRAMESTQKPGGKADKKGPAAQKGAGGKGEKPEKGSKKAAPASSSGSKSNISEMKKPLQAVLLADSFLEPPRFRPFTHDKPKVLLPLANAPMLEYALEFLARNGIQDIIIFATAHADQIAQYISTTRWQHRGPELTVSVMVSMKCLSVGDALRHIHESGRIVGDFVLISGDVIANLDLRSIIATHKTRVAQDSSIVMTVLFKPVPANHCLRTLDDDLVVAIDALSGELVYYDNDCSDSSASIPLSLLTDRRAIRVRKDLLDCNIAICSPMFLVSFADNFDYSDPRGDYMKQVMSRNDSDVLNDDRIFAVRQAISTRGLVIHVSLLILLSLS